MLLGKAVRLERVFNRDTHRTIIVPMDHGVTVGPIDGLIDMREAVNQVAEGGANAVLMHKGLPRCSHRGRGRDVGLIIHLSASTALSPYPNAKVLVATVEDALKLGADGVSLHVNLGDETERHMLEHFGEVTSKAAEWACRSWPWSTPGGPSRGRIRPRGRAPLRPGGHGDRRGRGSRCPTPATWTPSPRSPRPAASRWSSPAAPRWTTTGTCSRWPRLGPGRRIGPVHRPQHLPAPPAGAHRPGPARHRAPQLGRGPGHGTSDRQRMRTT